MSANLVVVDANELRELVVAAVREGVVELESKHSTVLLDRKTLARELGCSPRQVDYLRRRGLPFLRFGGPGCAPRFELAPVLEFLRQQGGGSAVRAREETRHDQHPARGDER